MKDGFPFHKYTMVYLLRKTLSSEKFTQNCNSQYVSNFPKVEYIPLKDHLFPTGNKREVSICFQ